MSKSIKADGCGIYIIEHKGSARAYVGQSCAIKRRWSAHISLLRKGSHHSPHLQHCWNKYGEDSFDFVVLELCSPDKLTVREQFYIDVLTPSFNVAPSAGSRAGVPQSAATRERIRAGVTGLVKSAETCKRLSDALIGRKLSAEHVAKIIEVKSNVSAETRRRISEAGKGRTASDDTKVKMSNAHRGRTISPEHREKLRAAMLGRTFSHESRAKMSASAKARKQKKREVEANGNSN